jgi:xanthine dehydrogenase small subunit
LIQLAINEITLIRFILNEKEIATELPPGMVLLDFIRYQQHLMGTKIGCREGDCGACTVLVGDLVDTRVIYQSVTCCLMPLGNAHAKHIVTIEGIGMPEGSLNPIQQSMSEEGATQCGFCTPGFVMSLAGFCLSETDPTYQNAIAAIDGNICRCTGYKSIQRAAATVATFLEERNNEEPTSFVSRQNILPSYFSNISDRLKGMAISKENPKSTHIKSKQLVGGGTDLYVQKHDEMTHADIGFVSNNQELKGIHLEGNECVIGASTTVTELKNSPLINQLFPNFATYARLISSTPIRNMATVGGNFINASPIGDLTVFFLALDCRIELVKEDGGQTESRNILLRDFYKGYKKLDRNPEEYLGSIRFELPGSHSRFHFEKVSKRTHLDIATVNTAISLTMEESIITRASISAGGVAPIPLYLLKTSGFLIGKEISIYLILEAIQVALEEISPISDARGTKEYKSLLLAQLIKAHFITLFPQLELKKLMTC